MMIKPIHIEIPGRARFKVRGLYRSESLKRNIESHLLQYEDILRVSASLLTGNVLVFFQPAMGYQTVMDILHQALPAPSKRISCQDKKLDKLCELLSGHNSSPSWHILETHVVFDCLGTHPQQGLSTKVVQDRLKRFGDNIIGSVHTPSRWKMLIDEFRSLPVLLLGIEVGISFLSGGILDAFVIGGMIGISVLIGFVTQMKFKRDILSFSRISNPPIEVLRNGRRETRPCKDIVPGDILVLRAGDFIGADCRIIQSSLLTIDESILTGESIPVAKNVAPLAAEDISLADRTNMVYRGTLVTGGEGRGIVIATGRQTALGQLQRMIDDTSPPETPIEKQLHQIGNQLMAIAGGISALICFSGLFYGGGFLQMVRTAVSVAASTIPSGLPAAAAINFAFGIKNMKKQQVAIRRLQGVETLGAVRTICFDKTGTITRSRLSVLKIDVGEMKIEIKNREFHLKQPVKQIMARPLKHEDLHRLIQTCMLCSETRPLQRSKKNRYVLKGQPTENALLHLGLLSQINFPALYEAYPLERKQHDPEDWLYLKTVHRTSDHSIRICVKGRPADVLARCNRRFLHGQAHPLTETDVLEIEARNGQLAGKALRVVGLAFKDGHETADCDAENDLVWLGLVAMAEPIRKGVTSLIDRLHKAGIRTIMITGDQHASAYAVARAIGLSGKDHIKLLDSNELRSVQPELMKALAQDVDVYSRVNPAQKIRIVQALQQAGHIVAMTGDGINDGPALKAADIGIAMGLSGTDVARDVADMILEKDNIHTLIPAVKEGRDTYGNIKKSIRFLLATNFSTMLFTFAAISMGLGRPLNLAQTLSIDIIADIFPGLALCMEPPETDSLAHPPRNVRDPVFNSEDYRRMAFEASTLSLGSLMAYGYGIARYGMGIKTGNLAFQSLTIAKLLHAVSCRSTNYSMFDTGKLPSNRYLNLALGSALLLELISITIPGLRRFLGISRLNLLDIAIIGAGGFLPLCVNEATKTKMIRQH